MPGQAAPHSVIAAVLHIAAAAIAAPAAAQPLPPPVAAQQAAWFAECRSFGGRPEAGPDLATRADLNGDGQPDYVLSVDRLYCHNAASALCSGQACPLALFLSGPGGYRRAFRENVHGWELDRSASPPALVAMWLPSHCGPRPRTRDGCSARYAISGQSVTEVGTPAAPSRPAPQPRQDGAASGRGQAVWYADLRASRLPRLLAGNDASVPVLVNGGQQGRLALAGSSAAIRTALAPCYPF